MTINKYISFDISLHSTLSEFNRNSLVSHPSLNELLTILSNNWSNIGYASLNECLQYKIIANVILTRYYNNPYDIGLEPLIIDKFISSKSSSGKLLYCKVDKIIELVNGSIEVIDYKTGINITHSSSPSYDYALFKSLYVIKKELGFFPQFFSYYYLRYNRKITIKISPNLISTLSSIYF